MSSKPEWAEGQSPHTSPARIAELLADPDPVTRRHAVGNATRAQLRGLVSDPDKRVRREVAKGDLLPADLSELADDSYDCARWSALGNTAMPPGKLASVASAAATDDLNTLLPIASNPSTPRSTRNDLAAHRDSSVSEAAIALGGVS